MGKYNEHGLTDKQEAFCQHYLVDLNGTQAAIRSGYSEKTAQAIATENLSKPLIQERIAALQAELSKKVKIDQEWVLNRFKEISDRCMTAIPVMIYDAESKSMIQKTDDEVSGVWEFDSAGANKATEQIGKHLGFFEKDKDKPMQFTFNAKMTKEEIQEIDKQLNNKY